MRTSRTIAATFLALFSSVAFAAPWDWDEEGGSRFWRSASLWWAQDIHPQHPSISWIDQNVEPPPREMWCMHQGTPPSQTDCDIHHGLVEDWAEAYTGTYVPWQDLDYPRECPSSCYP